MKLSAFFIAKAEQNLSQQLCCHAACQRVDRKAHEVDDAGCSAAG